VLRQRPYRRFTLCRHRNMYGSSLHHNSCYGHRANLGRSASVIGAFAPPRCACRRHSARKSLRVLLILSRHRRARGLPCRWYLHFALSSRRSHTPAPRDLSRAAMVPSQPSRHLPRAWRFLLAGMVVGGRRRRQNTYYGVRDNLWALKTAGGRRTHSWAKNSGRLKDWAREPCWTKRRRHDISMPNNQIRAPPHVPPAVVLGGGGGRCFLRLPPYPLLTKRGCFSRA